jgi:hypothetical protein
VPRAFESRGRRNAGRPSVSARTSPQTARIITAPDDLGRSPLAPCGERCAAGAFAAEVQPPPPGAVGRWAMLIGGALPGEVSSLHPHGHAAWLGIVSTQSCHARTAHGCVGRRRGGRLLGGGPARSLRPGRLRSDRLSCPSRKPTTRTRIRQIDESPKLFFPIPQILLRPMEAERRARAAPRARSGFSARNLPPGLRHWRSARKIIHQNPRGHSIIGQMQLALNQPNLAPMPIPA